MSSPEFPNPRPGGFPRGIAGGADPRLHYGSHQFQDDEKRLLAGAGPAAPGTVRTVHDLDGRMLVVPLDGLRRAAASEQAASKLFAEKYGSADGPCWLSRFRLVLRFLDDRRDELTASGLAAECEPPAIREELVVYLLNCEVDESGERIRPGALRRFLDEWSVRWI